MRIPSPGLHLKFLQFVWNTGCIPCRDTWLQSWPSFFPPVKGTVFFKRSSSGSFKPQNSDVTTMRLSIATLHESIRKIKSWHFCIKFQAFSDPLNLVANTKSSASVHKSLDILVYLLRFCSIAIKHSYKTFFYKLRDNTYFTSILAYVGNNLTI